MKKMPCVPLCKAPPTFLLPPVNPSQHYQAGRAFNPSFWLFLSLWPAIYIIFCSESHRGVLSLNTPGELFILTERRVVGKDRRWCTRPFWKRDGKGRWYGVKGDPGILVFLSPGEEGGDDRVWRECGDLKEREKDRKMKSGRCHDKEEDKKGEGGQLYGHILCTTGQNIFFWIKGQCTL